MTDLFWPGDERAGDHFTTASLLRAMVDVEEEWLDRLGHPADLLPLLDGLDPQALARAAEGGGNPVIPLVAALRAALGDSDPGRWLHRGLTSQDVLDTALVALAADAVVALRADLDRLAARLGDLARTHRDTPMVGRTLTQHAVPTTFGLRAAQWLTAVLDADDGLALLGFPDQLGGAAGTRAASAELGLDLGDAQAPWHTVRTTVTALGDALVTTTDGLARIAADVLVMARPEVGELAEGSPGGSSTMPGKANPVLSVLVRRAALTTPQLAATLHVAAAGQVDDRADGAWHAEWATLRDLVRRTLVAASQAVDLVGGLVVDTDRMAATLAGAGDAVLAEQATMAGLAGHAPHASYLGEAGRLVDRVLERLEER
jgi:3-carboxy-cis,cis-muconate cycloisomerase